jgi:coproporphyrinogen III oxidase-like Fe-S oxidoreductase
MKKEKFQVFQIIFKRVGIFFGGGTPSLANPNTFYEILNTLDKYSKIENSIEITMEANPTVIKFNPIISP